MGYRKIKYWKVLMNGLSLKDALDCFESQSFNKCKFETLGIRHGSYVYDPNEYDITRLKREKFNYNEIFDNKWEIIIPDDDKEQVLYKCRETIKKENFFRLSHEAIDHMDITALWQELASILQMTDEMTKYRLIKHIIENKLYKNHN